MDNHQSLPIWCYLLVQLQISLVSVILVIQHYVPRLSFAILIFRSAITHWLLPIDAMNTLHFHLSNHWKKFIKKRKKKKLLLFYSIQIIRRIKASIWSMLYFLFRLSKKKKHTFFSHPLKIWFDFFLLREKHSIFVYFVKPPNFHD